MITCRKQFPDIPFAHRQPNHKGHCSLIHGHNWAIALTFACSEFDENGFVIDFGDLGFIRAWINDNLDHAMVFSSDDPLRETLIAAADVWKPYIVENCSSEGLAKHFFEVFNQLVHEQTIGRVWITKVEVFEDNKNSASYTAINSSNYSESRFKA